MLHLYFPSEKTLLALAQDLKEIDRRNVFYKFLQCRPVQGLSVLSGKRRQRCNTEFSVTWPGNNVVSQIPGLVMSNI